MMNMDFDRLRGHVQQNTVMAGSAAMGSSSQMMTQMLGGPRGGTTIDPTRMLARPVEVPDHPQELQVLLFGELPRASSMLGASIIVLCTAGSAVRKWREGRAGGESATAAATVAAASDSAVVATAALTTSTSSQQPQDEGGAPDDAWVELNDAAKKARAAGDG